MLDIVIPVYNEGENIFETLMALRANVNVPFRILICYDFDEDNTLQVIEELNFKDIEIRYIRNTGNGPHQAILDGFSASTAPFVIVYMADDCTNARILNAMHEKAQNGCKIVCASRMMQGGKMDGAPWLKSLLLRIANFALYHFARIPTHDASNGFRLFSREVIQTIPIESKIGFTYSIELLVKVHRLGWRIEEIPSEWYERKKGVSRFQIIKWVPAYLHWFFYAFGTTYFNIHRL